MEGQSFQARARRHIPRGTDETDFQPTTLLVESGRREGSKRGEDCLTSVLRSGAEAEFAANLADERRKGYELRKR